MEWYYNIILLLAVIVIVMIVFSIFINCTNGSRDKDEYPLTHETIGFMGYSESALDMLWENKLKEINIMEKYPKITQFDINNINYINLPKPIPTELYEELFSKGILRKEELKKDSYYYGSCRNTNIAQWNGNNFTYMRYKFGVWFPENINHLSDDNDYDLFIPLKELTDVPKEYQINI